MLYSEGDLYRLGLEEGLLGIPPISGKYKRDSCLAYSIPATIATIPTPTDPTRSITRHIVVVQEDGAVDSIEDDMSVCVGLNKIES
mmetsp:Transcript_603/g.1094  ORF Transcript_603/g.1094 Transcript_603/m.1094 type:complete len:86 (-) Transcript_603:124-381(-)